MAIRDVVEGSFYQEITPSNETELPDAAQIVAQLRASGLSLDEIADRSDIPRRTLDDIIYGRSSGARTLSKLQPLIEKLQERHAERQVFDQIRELSRRQIFQEQAPKIMETARAAADLEIAALHREQEMRLYEAAIRYLGPSKAIIAQFCGNTPEGRQYIIEMAQKERAANSQRPIPWITPQIAAPRQTRQVPTAPDRLQIAAPKKEPAYVTQKALEAAHGPNCPCVVCRLAPWNNR